MNLVRPIFFILLLGCCLNLIGTSSYKTSKNKQIEIRKLTQTDRNEYFNGESYVSDVLNIHIRSFEIIPPNIEMNETDSILLIKFKFVNHSIEKLNEIVSWLECFEIKQAGHALEIANVSDSYRPRSKRSFKTETFDRSRGIIAYKLRSAKKDVMLKAYKIGTSKVIGTKKIKIIK